jgi:hypothetical protein
MLELILMNSRTGEIYLAKPCWEPTSLTSGDIISNIVYAKGTFAQVGWLITNKHDVIVKVPLNFNYDRLFKEIGVL